MIAEHAYDPQPSLDATENALHGGVNTVARATHLETVVACHHTEVHLQTPQALTDRVGKPHDAISMKVGEMEQLKSAVALRQVVVGQTDLTNDGSQRILLTAL